MRGLNFIFTQDERYALQSLSASYKKGCAEAIFSENEIAVMRLLIQRNKPHNTQEIADALDINRRTASTALNSLKEKEMVQSETSGRAILWKTP